MLKCHVIGAHHLCCVFFCVVFPTGNLLWGTFSEVGITWCGVRGSRARWTGGQVVALQEMTVLVDKLLTNLNLSFSCVKWA